MRKFYSIFFYLCTPFILLYFVFRGRKDRRYLHRWKERFGFYDQPVAGGGIVLHAASVGEFNAAAPLVRALTVSGSYPPLTVTTFTPTGSARAQSPGGAGIGHCYAPLDLPGAVRRFLDQVNPRLLIIMETEIWPNLYAQTDQRGIPILMVNARVSAGSFSSYRRFRSLTRETLERIAHAAAQSPLDAERLIALGADPARVSSPGNLKFDLDVQDGHDQDAAELRRQWGEERPVVIAASTHEADDMAILTAFGRVLEARPDTLLIMVPRHPERFAAVAGLTTDMGFSTGFYSDGKACSPTTQCFVIDAMGELLRYYACSDVAVIGGSFGTVGGHNALEAAALARPVIVGPDMRNFADITSSMLEAGAAIQVADTESLGDEIISLLDDETKRRAMGEAGFQMVEQGRGALLEIMQTVDRLLAS